MSKLTNIYPMAFVPNHEVMCKLYYVGFPKRWKDVLIKVEQMTKPKWTGLYALPTYALKNSLEVWMDGVIELAPLKVASNDEMWLISCEQAIDIDLLYQHIMIWLYSYYLSNKKLDIRAKQEIQNLIDSITIDELNDLKGNKKVRLFNEDGIPTESYSYNAFTLMVINSLIGKNIQIDGHDIVFNYAGKNHLISDIQGKDEYSYSYGISFSLQTVPPERRALLLCDCSIHRWIPGNWKLPFLSENINAHIWVGNNKIYQLQICSTDKDKYYWQEVAEKYYNLYNYNALPSAQNVIESLDKFLVNDLTITCLYKNGLNHNGFLENKIGTGVSVSEKKDIFDGVFSYIQGMVKKTEIPKRISSSRNARKNLPLNEFDLNNELSNHQKFSIANRIKACIEDNHLDFEIYYNDDNIECAKEIFEKLKSTFQNTQEMTYDITMCPLGTMSMPLDNDKTDSIIKRIKEIENQIDIAEKVTACIVLLPGKEAFKKDKDKDPKKAIRAGMAKTKRLTQFIVPWKDSNDKEEIKNKITSTIEDLCRQLGYIKELQEKVIDNQNALVHTPVIGMHVMTQINTIYQRARFLPLFVELDYISGKVYVECDAFEHVRVPYHEAAFELTKLSLDTNFSKKCDNASKAMFKQKMMMWKNLYRNKPVLILIEANGNTRSICKGITDSQLHKYSYIEPYCPKDIEVGTNDMSYKLNLNNSGVRFIRIRTNGEVPDYYTDLSTKGYTATSGIFKYGNDYWSVAERPNNKAYKSSYKNTTYNNSHQNFCKRDLIEIYPIQLQQGDNPDEWVFYTNSLRKGSIQYNEATTVPIPIHLAKKLEEYLLTI